jgi:hypothetical protein
MAHMYRTYRMWKQAHLIGRSDAASSRIQSHVCAARERHYRMGGGQGRTLWRQQRCQLLVRQRCQLLVKSVYKSTPANRLEHRRLYMRRTICESTSTTGSLTRYRGNIPRIWPAFEPLGWSSCIAFRQHMLPRSSIRWFDCSYLVRASA